ncbi:MAG: hypothetical protein FD174_1397 [Geobacteraceae bacterium]|nr:MAG: hypothetical protein FD174_1397 [Geobacteraceae bacterium]
MRIILSLCVLLVSAVPAGATTKTITLYLDGARVESEAAATKGYLEIPLPSGMKEGSLRLKPLGGGAIARVDVAPVRPGRKQERELARLAERKDSIADRLKALDTREDIFKAAAKSQSGKAPRKTRNNPEPLANIQQGTDFAIAQLEGVYRARRKAENELKALETSITAVKKDGNVGERTARVWLTGKASGVKASYITSDLSWAPRFDFRLDGNGQAAVVIHAVTPQTGKGVTVAVVPAAVAEASAEAPLPAASESLAKVAAFTFPVEKEQFSPSLPPSLSFSVKNLSSRKFPAGEASCYWKGEYLGNAKFPGFQPGETRELACGR